MTDLVNEFLTRLQKQIPNLTEHVPPHVLLQVENEMRHARSGNRAYVGKTVSRFTRTSLLASGLRKQRPLGEVFASASVSRSTGYRLLASK